MVRNKIFRRGLAAIAALSLVSLSSCSPFRPFRIQFTPDGMTIYGNTPVLEIPVEKIVKMPCPEISKVPAEKRIEDKKYKIGGREYTCPEIYNATNNNTFEEGIGDLKRADERDKRVIKYDKEHRDTYH